MTTASFRVIGRGRAGASLAGALTGVGPSVSSGRSGEAIWREAAPLGRGDDLSDAAVGVDLVVIATPDAAIAGVAQAIEPQADTVVIHLAGSLGLDVLAPHPRRGALHPLVSLPSASIGAARLADRAWFAVAGDPLVSRIVEELGGRSFTVADEDRATYHAAAVVASNHVVVLLGQVQRLADRVGVPFDAFLEMTRATVDNVADLGAQAALTGPAARGDRATIERHLAALDPDERVLYEVLSRAAADLATPPGDR